MSVGTVERLDRQFYFISVSFELSVFNGCISLCNKEKWYKNISSPDISLNYIYNNKEAYSLCNVAELLLFLIQAWFTFTVTKKDFSGLFQNKVSLEPCLSQTHLADIFYTEFHFLVA